MTSGQAWLLSGTILLGLGRPLIAIKRKDAADFCCDPSTFSNREQHGCKVGSKGQTQISGESFYESEVFPL